MTDFLVCSVILEFSFCKFMCIRTACLCWLHSICFPFIVPLAPIKWSAACFHSPMGHQHLYLQRGIYGPKSENVEGILHWVHTLCLVFTIIRDYCDFDLLNMFSGCGNLGNYWLMALPNSRILSSCTILSWCPCFFGQSGEQFCFPLLVRWG